MTLLDDRIRAWSARWPGRLALAVQDGGALECLSWREADDRTARVAAALAEAADGVPWPCVAVPVGEAGMADLVLLIAALRCPYPVVVYRPADRPDDELARHGLSTVLTRDGVVTGVRKAARERGSAPLPADAIVLASGGSGGRPKLVVDTVTRSAAGRPSAVRAVHATGWVAGQRQLTASPLYHSSALAFVVEGLADGHTAVRQRRFHARSFMDLVEELAVAWLQTVPYHLTQLVEVAPRPEQVRSVAGLVHLAAACPARTKRFWHGLLGPDRVHEMYSSSERIGITMARGDEWERRPGTVGRGFFTHVTVLDDELRPVPAGEPGRVFLRTGRRAHPPYLAGTGRMAATPHGFRTVGDTGRLDEDGYLFLEPRQVASISVAGVTVLPDEVESVLLEHPSVLDAAVCAVPDEIFGERPVALVVPAAGAPDGRSVRAWASTRLSPAQLPVRVELVARLPRDDAGKLRRHELPALVGGARHDG